jgi:hypothetical protein
MGFLFQNKVISVHKKWLIVVFTLQYCRGILQDKNQVSGTHEAKPSDLFFWSAVKYLPYDSNFVC